MNPTTNVYWKTIEVARILGVPDYRLHASIRYGRIMAPVKDGSGDYVWTEADIEAARQALAVGHPRRVAVLA